MTNTDDVADILIAGGGSAGCVLASRLSEDPATRVVLLEAGRDLTAELFPGRLASAYPGRAYFDRGWLWPQLAAARGDTGTNRPGTARFYEQARILGGGSSINGICANRGSPYDYDEWADAGAAGWGWTDVLPYFRKLESDRDFDDPLHGQSGPLPIRRHRTHDWTGYTRAVADSFAAMGYTLQQDQNGEWADGIFPTTHNVDDQGRRASAAVAYLTPEVRRRPNLRIMTETVADRLVIEGKCVTGVRAKRGGETIALSARQIILSMGALQTPVMLMRSGIGPALHLRERGITVHADRQGIGENLLEHPNIGVSAFLDRQARLPPGDGHHLQALLRYSSGLPGTPPGDMHVAISARSSWHAVGRRIGSLGFWVNKSYSRGRVRLGATPDAAPDIDFRMLSDPRDMERLKHGFRLGVRALSAPVMAGTVLDIFPSGFSARIRALTRPTPRNAVVMAIAAPIMDRRAELRRRFMAYAMETTHPVEMLVEDDGALETHLRRSVGGTWHPCGTCRMGDPADPMAVTDAAGRVIGVEGLRACDASIMPTVPCANLNVPVLMSAEKIADAIKAEARPG
jgi:5-(hydroxymethyl)furfural/furfural oxidase